MKSRKLLTVLLCLFLLVGLAPVNVLAQDETSEPGEKAGEVQQEELDAPAEENEGDLPGKEAGEDAEDTYYVTIGSFNVSARSGGKWNDDGDYVWKADTSEAGHPFVFRISYNISGTFDFQPGDIIITIPKSTLLDREGNASDVFELSIPEDNEQGLTDSVFFTYHVDGDNIVITNRLTVPLGQTGYFDVSYSTSRKTFY
jgi:hypothetical protein